MYVIAWRYKDGSVIHGNLEYMRLEEAVRRARQLNTNHKDKKLPVLGAPSR